MKKLLVYILLLELLVGASPTIVYKTVFDVALVEQMTDSEISNVTRDVKLEILEHYGNPAFFIRYIIAIPPVYV